MGRPYKTSGERMNSTFATLVHAASTGARCPENGAIGIDRQAMPPLARAGRIRIDIYAKNYRVVTILEGEHKGKMTAPPPAGAGKPYLTIQKDDTPRSYASKAPITLPSSTIPWGKRP